MSTCKNLSYRLCMTGCFLVIFNVHVRQLIAQMDSNVIQVNSLKVSPEVGYCTGIGLFLDSDGSVVAFFSVDGFIGRKSKIFIFSQHQDEWHEKEKSYDTTASRIISNGKLSFVTYDKFLQESQGRFEVYDLTEDFGIASQPRLSLDMSSTQKFKNEGSRNIISAAAGNDSDSFLLLGDYFASNLNLLTFLPRILSAGHAGIVEIPFAAQITKGNVTGFYNLKTKFEDTEYVSDIQGITEGHTVHVIWIKGKSYGPDTPKVMYAQFDLDTHHWSEITELFRGTKFKSKIVRYFSEPSVLLLGENLHCAWANANMQDDRGQPLDKPLSSSGVFYRVKNKDVWSSIYKISNCDASRCKLAAGKDQDVHLFWIDYKRVYHTYKDLKGWQDATLIYEDPALDWTHPFDVKIDQSGNFHLIYIRESSVSKPFELIPKELMYVKIEKQM